ncbi:MAG: peptidase S10, partial [Vicinamibacteria bacterium]
MSPILLTVLLAAFAQDPRSDAAPRDAEAPQEERAKDAVEKEKDKKDDEKAKPEEPPVVTRHEMKVGGKLLKYTVTTGFMPLANEDGKTEARIFFMAYALDRPAGGAARPLMFSFNGGPGSSSVWLHLGALGPKRVKMLDDGGLPAPPYQLVDNDQNWLEFTDLVFVDPVGTGYSRAVKPTDGKKYW